MNWLRFGAFSCRKTLCNPSHFSSGPLPCDGVTADETRPRKVDIDGKTNFEHSKLSTIATSGVCGFATGEAESSENDQNPSKKSF
jgi:hypothetical protein